MRSGRGKGLSHAPRSGRPGPQLSAAILILVVFGTVGRVGPSWGQEPDSLKCHVQDRAIKLSFQLPVPVLKIAGIEQALEEQGLSAECMVSIEVKERGGLRSKTFVRVVNVRTLTYSRWYDEYILSENAEEILSDRSYYKTLDSYRRYDDLKIVDVGILERDKEFTVVLEVKAKLRFPDNRGDSGDFVAAGFSLPGELVDVFRKKGVFYSFKVESETFSGGEVPGQLLGTSPPPNSETDHGER
jgi:hypothetical protein